MKKKKAYGGSALDGDFEEAGALALSPFETGSLDAAAFLASELTDASQVINQSNLNRHIRSCIKDKLTLK